MPFYRYSRWDGTQQVFPVHEDDLMEQLSEHLMQYRDVSSALRSIAQRGVRGRFGQSLPGIQELLQRLRSLRQQTLERYDLGSVLEDIEGRLRDIVETERRGIQRHLEEVRERFQRAKAQGTAFAGLEALLNRAEQMAQRKLAFLEGLPEEPAQVIQQLRDYEFTDSEARAKFEQLLRSLQRRVLDSLFRDLSQRLRTLTPQQLAGLKEMVRELNELLEERLGGGRPDISRFMQNYGHLFGPHPPASLEELVEQMGRQMAQMESFLKSLSPEQRRELEGLLNSAFRDEELREELARLAANLGLLGQPGGLAREFPFQGEEPLTLEEALRVIERLQRMDELERQLRRTQQGYSASDVDSALTREVLGEEAYQELEQLKHLSELLEQAGYIRRVGTRYELTPKGIRKIGQRALREIFAYIKKDRLGPHPVRSAGWGGEMVEETKRYEFGDTFSPSLQRSILNALYREAGLPVRLRVEDFEVYKREEVARAATVLMIDLSLSMAMRGNFLAAKKVALALDNLIRTQFPRDEIFIVGFSTYAREIKPDRLPYLTWDEFDPYTNIQHALALARKLLAKRPVGTKQIIMVSDGEPTAHIEGGQLFLQYPPSPRTIRETLREVKRCTRQGIVINTFMLERSSYLVEFIDQLTRINRGRVFYTSPERLGEYMLVDYIKSRRRLLF